MFDYLLFERKQHAENIFKCLNLKQVIKKNKKKLNQVVKGFHLLAITTLPNRTLMYRHFHISLYLASSKSFHVAFKFWGVIEGNYRKQKVSSICALMV